MESLFVLIIKYQYTTYLNHYYFILFDDLLIIFEENLFNNNILENFIVNLLEK